MNTKDNSNGHEMTTPHHVCSSSVDEENSEMTTDVKEDKLHKLIADADVKLELLHPSDLQGLKKTSLEIAMEYSYMLRQRAKNEWLDGEKIQALGTSLEDYATSLIEPLKQSDNKEKIAKFEYYFERIAETALLYEQKKFLCHMVFYNHLMRKWSGIFYGIKYSSAFTLGWFKWILLLFWTVIDMAVFPLVMSMLYLFHRAVRSWKRNKEYNVIFLLHQSQPDTLPMMLQLCNTLTDIFKPSISRFACIIQKHDVILSHTFSCEHDKRLIWQGDVSGMDKETIMGCGSEGELTPSLVKVRDFLSECNDHSMKTVVVMSDASSSVSFPDPLTNVKVIAVMVGDNACVDNAKPLTRNEEDIILYHEDCSKIRVCRQLCQCLFGKDLYEYYHDYFSTPFFIFCRDAMSYFILLGLHFAVCLQPSFLYLSAIEWCIMVLFLGRFLMELDQLIRLKIQLKFTGFTATSKYFSDPWNRMDVLTLVIYIALLAVRIIAWSRHVDVQNNRLLAVSGYMYGLNAMIITLRVLGHLMEANASLGTIQIALLQIIGSCLAILGQFLIALVAFSLAITKVYVAEISYKASPNVTAYGLCDAHGGFKCWWSLTKYLAWSMLGFGGPEQLQSEDDTSDVIAQALYYVFLVLAVVILMNMMIALLSNTYQHVEDNAYYEWSYRKTAAIVTYFTHHPVPVPFNIASLLYILVRHLWRKCAKTRRTSTTSRLNEKVFKRLIASLEDEYISAHGNRFSHQTSDATQSSSQTTKHYQMIMDRLNNLYGELHTRFVELNASYSSLQEDYKNLRQDMSSMEEKLQNTKL